MALEPLAKAASNIPSLDSDAAKRILALTNEFLEKISVPVAGIFNVDIADYCDKKLSVIQQQVAAACSDKLNDVGNACAQRKQSQHMREITDRYAQLRMLLDDEEVTWPAREARYPVEFAKPLAYRHSLIIRQIAAVRTKVLFVRKESAHLHRVTDGLLINFKFAKQDPSVNRANLAQGWIGSEEQIREKVEAHYGKDSPHVPGHVAGRLWDHAETHDVCAEHIGAMPDGTHALTFVAQDAERPSLFNGTKEIYFDDFYDGRDITRLEDMVKRAKPAIGGAIMKHLRSNR